MEYIVCACGNLKKKTNIINEVIKELLCPLCGTKLKERGQTKITSYLEINENDAATLRNLILKTIKLKEGTDREIAKRLGFKDPNKVRPRRFELVEMGLIKGVAKRQCGVTGKTANVWGEI